MLIDGFHELWRPEPNIVVFVHEQKCLFRDLLLYLRHSLCIKALKELHDSLHVLFVPTVQQKWLHLHASLQLRGKLSYLCQTFLAFVQIDHSSIPLLSQELGSIFGRDCLEYSTYKFIFFCFFTFLSFRRLRICFFDIFTLCQIFFFTLGSRLCLILLFILQ